MSLNPFEKQVFTALETYAQANEANILASLKGQNVALSDLVEQGVAAVIAKNALLQMVFGGVVKEIAPQLINALGSEEAVLYAMGIAELKTLAAS
jgi:hypothetical protein